jgi:hypothetical protein
MALLTRLLGKVRCPACASVARHPRNGEREAEVRKATDALVKAASGASHKTDQGLEGMGVSPMGRQRVRAFVRGSCGHGFDREAEVTWAHRARKVGDARTVAEYPEVFGLGA